MFRRIPSGLRIGEACKLSWTDPPVRLDGSGAKYPRILWGAGGQKNRKDEVTVVTPEFWRVVSGTHEDDRSGLVFPITIDGHRIQRDRIGRLVSDVGESAGITTPAGTATSHDLRRTFGTRMAESLKPVNLRSVMRHKDLKTTLTYYVDQTADDVGDDLWSCAQKSTLDRETESIADKLPLRIHG